MLDDATVSIVNSIRVKSFDIEKVPEACIQKSVTMTSIKNWQKENNLNHDQFPKGVELERTEGIRITLAKEKQEANKLTEKPL